MSIEEILFKVIGVACCVGLFLIGMFDNTLNPLELVGILILICGILCVKPVVPNEEEKDGDK